MNCQTLDHKKTTPLRHGTKPEPLAITGTLYVKDFQSANVDTCNTLMPLKDLSRYIYDEEPGKYHFICFKVVCH